MALKTEKSRANLMAVLAAIQAKLHMFMPTHESTTHQTTAQFLLHTERKQANERVWGVLQFRKERCDPVNPS